MRQMAPVLMVLIRIVQMLPYNGFCIGAPVSRGFVVWRAASANNVCFQREKFQNLWK